MKYVAAVTLSWSQRGFSMDTSEAVIFLAYPNLSALYSLAVVSSVSLFLFFYIALLISQGKRGNVTESVSLPMWFNFMYPGWLDKVTCQGIVKAFAMALCLALVTWTIVALIFITAMMKVYGP
jgi:hypothetical protein